VPIVVITLALIYSTGGGGSRCARRSAPGLTIG
jgi:hypothetical protein